MYGQILWLSKLTLTWNPKSRSLIHWIFHNQTDIDATIHLINNRDKDALNKSPNKDQIKSTGVRKNATTYLLAKENVGNYREYTKLSEDVV